MSKVIAIMSMSLDGYVADPNDGVAAPARRRRPWPCPTPAPPAP